MRAHYLQHVPFEGLGSIEPWLRQAGYEIGATRLFDGDPMPGLVELDLLVIMGGPMSVNDEQEHPWLMEEKALIRQAIDAGVAVLGVCLGAQLIAAALGARVYPNPAREIGWFPIQGLALASPGQFALPAQTTVLHWHGETFDLPAGSTQLAQSAACSNQAFQLGAGVLGLQFHLEATTELLQGLVQAEGDSLEPAAFVQPGEVILERAADFMPEAQRLMTQVLDYLHRYARERLVK